MTEAVLTSAKYRTVSPALARAIGAAELAKGRSLKEAVKATKNKLHQVAGAYLAERPDYGAWLEATRSARAAGSDLRPLCAALMRHHASTRERLPILEQFYATLLGDLPPVRSILDLACGLNPLALPWMPLPSNVEYWACDIFQDQADFLSGWFDAAGYRGRAFVCDLIAGLPPARADVVLLLKAIPCLEQIDKELGRRLLATVEAPVVLVSFPVHSLGGHGKGMAANYAAHFDRLTSGLSWQVERFDFATELVFRLRR